MISTLKATNWFIIALASCLMLSCGSDPGLFCNPNFSQGDFSARVTYVVGSLNEYQFEVCTNSTHTDKQVSVYGVQYESDIASLNTTADVRLAHLIDGLHPGDTFDVIFNNDDAWFVIYEDDNNGNFDTSTEVIRGQFR